MAVLTNLLWSSLWTIYLHQIFMTCTLNLHNVTVNPISIDRAGGKWCWEVGLMGLDDWMTCRLFRVYLCLSHALTWGPVMGHTHGTGDLCRWAGSVLGDWHVLSDSLTTEASYESGKLPQGKSVLLGMRGPAKVATLMLEAGVELSSGRRATALSATLPSAGSWPGPQPRFCSSEVSRNADLGTFERDTSPGVPRF